MTQTTKLNTETMKDLINFAKAAQKEAEKYELLQDVGMTLDNWIESAVIHKDEGHSVDANDKQAVQAFVEDVAENGQFDENYPDE